MPATIAQLQRLLEGEIDTWFLEKRYFHRDGHLLWGRSTTWLVRDADGQPSTSCRRCRTSPSGSGCEEQMRRQQAELAHVLRVATMGETVAQIAHEVNQPLASIANFANGLIARLDRGSVDVAATRAVADGDRRRGAARQRGDPPPARVSAQGRAQAGALRRQRHRPRRHAADRARRSANTPCSWSSALAPHPLPVEVDRVQVAQVVLNLIRNAVDAMFGQPTGARDLAIATERGERRGRGARARQRHRPAARRPATRSSSRSSRPSATASGSACRSAARSSKPTAARCGRCATAATARPSASRCPPR